MATCSKCGWALDAAQTTKICQTCAQADAALADAALDAEVAALAQASEEERRVDFARDIGEHGIEGALAKELLSSRDNRKILLFGAIGVFLIGVVAVLVANHLEDGKPKLNVASVVDARKPAVNAALSKLEAVAKHVGEGAEVKPPPSDVRDSVVLNFSGQPGDATATLLELRQITEPPPHGRLLVENPRHAGVLRMLEPDFVEVEDAAERIERAQWAKYHTSWIQATSVGGDMTSAIHALLAEHFDVFNAHGE